MDEINNDRLPLGQSGWAASTSCLVPTRGRDGQQASAETALMEAINAVLAHGASSSPAHGPRKDGGSIVVLLKRGCLKSLRAPSVLCRAADYAGQVLHFLLGFVMKRPDHLLQVAEVFNILLSSDEWLQHLRPNGDGGLVVQELLSLSSEQQAALGMQNDELLAMMSPEVAQLAHDQPSRLLQDAGQVRMELEKIRSGLGEGGLRFKSSVQELRFEPSYRSGLASKVASAPDNPTERGTEAEDPSPTGWRSTTTPEGNRYYYHHRTKEVRHVPPTITVSGSPEAELPCAKPRVGEKVEVFSNSVQRWCPGFVEKVSRTEVTIAFQLPNARANEWSKKSLALGHSELRWVSRAPGSPMPSAGSTLDSKRATTKPASGFFGTSLPTNWAPEEVQLYDSLFAELEGLVCGPNENGMDPLASAQLDYIAQSGLPRRALREIWQVANPHLRASLGLEEFRACCRLVGHCQAMSTQSEDDKELRQLRAGGGGLRAHLRSSCLAEPAPRLADFSQPKKLPCSNCACRVRARDIWLWVKKRYPKWTLVHGTKD
ncbi:unnamed protein product [Effrenium voratum]|uniref:WW domain-containing protein n=1 Tax=Effrenium voratum TaxID=2562239 RepID=A0AA36MTS3_9DINO|nr:unnamed protein product [Effrenium voratum]CAJ1433051.1 unnamed protein product [Effrenium voratum]